MSICLCMFSGIILNSTILHLCYICDLTEILAVTKELFKDVQYSVHESMVLSLLWTACSSLPMTQSSHHSNGLFTYLPALRVKHITCPPYTFSLSVFTTPTQVRNNNNQTCDHFTAKTNVSKWSFTTDISG